VMAAALDRRTLLAILARPQLPLQYYRGLRKRAGSRRISARASAISERV
jgi:hypothetical protein